MDYLLCQEYLVEGVNGSISPLLNKDIPECLEINWLGSVIKKNGNYVWHKTTNAYNDDKKWIFNLLLWIFNLLLLMSDIIGKSMFLKYRRVPFLQ